MPSKAQYQLQALKNENFFGEFDLQTTPYADWALVAIFYAALHHVESYFSTTAAGNARNHSDRYGRIRNDPKISMLSKPYQELRRRCDNARYDLVPIPAATVADLFQDEFQTIKKQISTLV